jgi:uncharacterized protein (TIGR02598 family)
MKKHCVNGFSLIEVCMALAIISFSLLAILGLVPAGLLKSKTAIDQTAAASIMTAIHSDLRTTAQNSANVSPRYSLTIPVTAGDSTIQTLFFQDDSAPIGTPNEAPNPSATPLYRVTVYLTAPSAAGGSTVGRVQITWPALADLTPGIAPEKFSGSMDTSIGLLRN